MFGLRSTGRWADIFSDGVLLRPAALSRDRLVGHYACYDDGWLCRLGLTPESDGLALSFTSFDRALGDFPASVSFDPGACRLTFTVYHFNEVESQVYTAYVATRGPVTFAGWSEWKGEPYAFFAVRRPLLRLGRTRPGSTRPEDFLGAFDLYVDGGHATVEFASVASGTLAGRLTERAGGGGYAEHEVTAVLDPVFPYVADITVHGLTDGEAVLRVGMFSRFPVAMGGWLDWAGVRAGCHLVRCAWNVLGRAG